MNQWVRATIIILSVTTSFVATAATSLDQVQTQSVMAHPKVMQLTKEFRSLYQFAEKTQPERQVGGLLNEIKVDDYYFLWRLAKDETEYDIIRIFRPKKNGKDFGVTYYLANHIVEGRWVLRRFIGPERGGWRADTIDTETNEYLGYQGATRPIISEDDAKILKRWGIQL